MPGQYENKDPKKCEKYGYAREQFKAWKNVLKQWNEAINCVLFGQILWKCVKVSPN